MIKHCHCELQRGSNTITGVTLLHSNTIAPNWVADMQSLLVPSFTAIKLGHLECPYTSRVFVPPVAAYVLSVIRQRLHG